MRHERGMTRVDLYGCPFSCTLPCTRIHKIRRNASSLWTLSILERIAHSLSKQSPNESSKLNFAHQTTDHVHPRGTISLLASVEAAEIVDWGRVEEPVRITRELKHRSPLCTRVRHSWWMIRVALYGCTVRYTFRVSANGFPTRLQQLASVGDQDLLSFFSRRGRLVACVSHSNQAEGKLSLTSKFCCQNICPTTGRSV